MTDRFETVCILFQRLPGYLGLSLIHIYTIPNENTSALQEIYFLYGFGETPDAAAFE